jgi:hypothetical protein
MNKVQRVFLICLSCFVLISHGFSDLLYARFAFFAVLFFIAISPNGWWKKISPVINEVPEGCNKNGESVSESRTDLQGSVGDVSGKDIRCDMVLEEIGGNKELIRVSQQNIAYCLSLYRLRMAEMSRSEDQILMMVEDDKDACWALDLLKQCAKYEGYHWMIRSEEEEKKLEQAAMLAYEKKFSFLFGGMVRPDDDAVVDMQAFLSVYSGSCRGMLKRLKYFKEIRFAETIVNALTTHYSTILKKIDDNRPFSSFLERDEKNDADEEIFDVRTAMIKVRSLWAEVEELLISMLLVAADAKIDITNYIQEMEMFHAIRDSFRDRLLHKNNIELREDFFIRASKEQDQKFREYFEQHPIYVWIFE